VSEVRLVAYCGKALGSNRREKHSDQEPSRPSALCRSCYDRSVGTERHFARAQPGELWHVLVP